MAGLGNQEGSCPQSGSTGQSFHVSRESFAPAGFCQFSSDLKHPFPRNLRQTFPRTIAFQLLAPNAGQGFLKFSSLGYSDQHRQPGAGNQEVAAGQRELISEQHKGQRVLLAENAFLKSIVTTVKH